MEVIFISLSLSLSLFFPRLRYPQVPITLTFPRYRFSFFASPERDLTDLVSSVIYWLFKEHSN